LSRRAPARSAAGIPREGLKRAAPFVESLRPLIGGNDADRKWVEILAFVDGWSPGVVRGHRVHPARDGAGSGEATSGGRSSQQVMASARTVVSTTRRLRLLPRHLYSTT
jgi:hypothetical protein